MSKPNSPAVTRANLVKNNNKELTLQDVIRELHAMRDENKKNVAEMIDSQTEKFNAVNNQLTKIQEDQSNLLVQHQNLKGNLENLTTSHFSLSNDFVASKNQVNKLTSTVQGLTVQLNELKQTQLSQNIIINGIPANIILDKSHICQLAQQLEVNLSLENVLNVKKIRTKKAALTMVTFATKDIRDTILLARRGKSLFSDEIGLGEFQQERYQIYMQEDLTSANQELLYHARRLKKYGFSGSWSSDGRITVKNQSTNKLVYIKSVSQVDEMIKFYEDSNNNQ
jgi:hypothetical protein